MISEIKNASGCILLKTDAGIVFFRGETLYGYENLHNMLTKYLN